eukprot:6561-Chlamydomonas_euryale.AAC.2
MAWSRSGRTYVMRDSSIVTEGFERCQQTERGNREVLSQRTEEVANALGQDGRNRIVPMKRRLRQPIKTPRRPGAPRKPLRAEAMKVGRLHIPMLHPMGQGYWRANGWRTTIFMPFRRRRCRTAHSKTPCRCNQCAVHVEHAAELAHALRSVQLVDAAQKQRLHLLCRHGWAVAPNQCSGTINVRSSWAWPPQR